MRICIITFLLVNGLLFAKPDVTVVGFVRSANGLGHVTTSWFDILSRQLQVGFIDSRPHVTDLEGVPIAEKIVAAKQLPAAPVSVLTDVPWLNNEILASSVPKSLIRFAYSMCESTKIPGPWVPILNNSFDAVIVPDPYLVEVYQNSGVTIPVFVLPIAIYLDDMLSAPVREQPNRPFVFGVSAALSSNKNVDKLIKAFARLYKNDPSVRLVIHSPWEGNSKELRDLIKKMHLKNVSIDTKPLKRQDYLNFIESIDCYVLLSKGEGFSITVREALAMGKPCVISDNTAHKTIIKTGYVYPVPANIIRPSQREFYGVDVGNNFDCEIDDVVAALETVYSNYAHYKSLALEGREWVKQYLPERLSPLYLTMIKPKNIVLGSENKITEDTLITNNKTLYEKFSHLYFN